MLKKINTKKAILILAALVLLVWPKLSYAEWRGGHHGDRHYYRYHDRPHFGLSVSFLPYDHYVVWSSGRRYYYYDGLYYNRIGGNYVIVAPPAGAVVNAIPSDYQPVIVNGTTYYVDNGVYYVRTPNGYQVVPSTSQEKFGISDVIVLSKAGVSDAVIIDKIVRTGAQYNLSVEEVEALRKEGVSRAVVNFMLEGR